MKKSLFMTTAAIAMLAGVHFVNAQAGGGAGGGSSGGSGGGGSTSSMGNGGSGGMGGSGGAAQTQRGSGGEMQRGGSDQSSGQRPGTTASEKQTPGSAQQSQDRRPSDSSTRPSQSGSSTQPNTGSAPAGGHQVSAEQRTKIKSHMGELRAGRVNNVNFSISVGTVVPHSVTLHALPPAVVEIVPAYRGYRYILVQDEIVIIDPNTLRIVAVIDA